MIRSAIHGYWIFKFLIAGTRVYLLAAESDFGSRWLWLNVLESWNGVMAPSSSKRSDVHDEALRYLTWSVARALPLLMSSILLQRRPNKEFADWPKVKGDARKQEASDGFPGSVLRVIELLNGKFLRGWTAQEVEITVLRTLWFKRMLLKCLQEFVCRLDRVSNVHWKWGISVSEGGKQALSGSERDTGPVNVKVS